MKLKPAKRYLKEFYLYPADTEIFQENDIMLGIAYALKWGRRLGMPLSVCLGLGTSQGAHMGESPLSQYIDYTAGFSQVSVSVAAGNEGAARHHFSRELGPSKTSETADESPLSQYIDYTAGFSQVSVSVAAGNEGAARHHFSRELGPSKTSETAELKVGENEPGFTLEFWGSPLEEYELSIQSPTGETLNISSSLGAGTQALSFVGENEPGFTLEFWGSPLEEYELSIQSPTGETLNISSSLGAGTQALSFVFVETMVLVNYVAIERQTGSTLVYFRFFHPAAGIWKITVTVQDGKSSGFHMWLPVTGLISPETYFLEASPYHTVTSPGDSIESITATAYQYRDNSFHMWLPVTGLISPETYFLEASPYHTVTSPGDSIESITATAYQYRDNSLYLQAGRGFRPDGGITPDLAAPGVELLVPLLRGGFGTASGTSLSAAMTAGVAALLFEWAVIRGNQPYFTGTNVKHYLERGARREERISYPNREWGYGRLDLYHTFELLS